MITFANRAQIDYSPLSHEESLKDKIHLFLKKLQTYFFGVLPILQWIHRYNFSWLLQDTIAGTTVGMLIVPQGIAYAKIANLDPQYGLYTSFVGVTLYCFFGTSKDISIGPITVVSLLVGQAISKVTQEHPNISGPEVAACLSLFAGITTLIIGLIRLGILVDFISEPVIAGYMTGSAITISLGQWPKVFGLQVNTHQAPYLIVYGLFEHLKEIKLDAAFGITALVLLYIIKLGGTRLASRIPALKKPLFFLGIMRSGLVVVVGTLISYFINVNRKSDPIIKIIEEVPAGFDGLGAPSLNMTIFKEVSSVFPSIILIMILEHVSVAKSFGCINNYVINPNQEILAIGISNIIGSFFGAYPSTGAFSRTAVMARSGAKTPMAGVFSGSVVLLALYVLTPTFYYIPESVLASVVIHAVIDLVSGPKFIKELWQLSILEFFIFVIAVVITCFIDVETGIYVSVGLSLLLMLMKIARPSVSSLGRVKLTVNRGVSMLPLSGSRSLNHFATSTEGGLKDVCSTKNQDRYIYVEETDPHYTQLMIPLPPGVVVVRISSSILYPNANYVSESISKIIKSRTRPGNDNHDFDDEEGRAWSHPLPNEDYLNQPLPKPYLDSIVLDFSAVDKLDVTAIHTLHSIRRTFDQYTSGMPVEFHFCHINSIEVRQLLIKAGFGRIGGAEARPLSSNYGLLGKNNEEIRRPKSTNYGICGNGKSAQTVTMNPDINDNAYSDLKDYTYESPTALLPSDKYSAFHWDIEAAVYAISERLQHKQTCRPSSIVVTTSY